MKLFIFDMGGVVTSNVACIPEMAASLGIGVDAFFRGTLADPSDIRTSPYNTGDIAELMKGTISPGTFWTRFNARTGLAVQEDLWAAFFRPEPDEGTYAVIAALRSNGWRVVCGTNTMHAHYESHLACKHYACFDAVYASHRMGVIKPDPAFWHCILDAESCEPNEAFFTDDDAGNVRAAGELGLRAQLFVDSSTLAASLGEWTGKRRV
ncbi:MAG: haloacid dehalogenase [Spirochaetae bacterium HGW-Spirochaetae-7]|jgi:putative hydrolase of the HAD superfamily|nr:MAG: haloacid dehalogenase [Spirochaetae bacterium HGW-Spirochaetae-7]